MRVFNTSKSWKVDHTYDPSNNLEYQDDDISTISGGSQPPAYSKDPSLILETPAEKKLRKRSHWVAYITMFVMSIGFSVVLSGVWPYLELLDDSLSKEALGWVVASNPLGQMLASPVVGYIGNRLGSIRVVCYFTMTVFIFGNMVYAFLPAMDDWWDHSAFHIMIIARFLVGLSSANVTLCRSYLAVSTTQKERTAGMALVSASQSLGFVVGPAIQTVLSLTISDEMMTYRSCGWVAAALGVINFVVLTPWIFQEFNIAEKEKALIESGRSKEEEYVYPPTDYYGMGAILFGFFMTQFIYVLIETLMEPFMADQYEWCNELAVIVVGISLGCAGILTVFMYLLATKLSKMFDERLILILGAYIPISIGLFLFIPWGPEKLNYCNNTDISTTEPSFLLNEQTYPLHNLFQMEEINEALMRADQANSSSKEIEQMLNITLQEVEGSVKSKDGDDGYCEEGCYGCPEEQEWCVGYNKLPLGQFYVAYVIVFAGYPFGIAMGNSIFSKMLGPKPQGTWMGVLTASGSLARVLGPICVSYLYANKGTILTFGVIVVGMVIATLISLLMYKRIVPMKPKIIVDGKRN